LAYAAVTKDEAQRSIRPFYEAVIFALTIYGYYDLPCTLLLKGVVTDEKDFDQ